MDKKKKVGVSTRGLNLLIALRKKRKSKAPGRWSDMIDKSNTGMSGRPELDKGPKDKQDCKSAHY